MRVPAWLYHLARIVTPRRALRIATVCATLTGALLWAIATRAGASIWLYVAALILPIAATALVWCLATRADHQA